jgi:hypothetical protein
VFGGAGSTGAMTVGTVTLPASITNLSLISGSSITVASGAAFSDTNASSSVLLQGASLALSGSVFVNGTNSVLTLNTTGTATQSAAITAINLALLGTGGSYTLNNAGNMIGTVAANTGSVSLTSGQALTIGTVSGTVGLSSTSDIILSSAVSWGNGTLTLTAGGNITINGTMSGGTTGDLTAMAAGNLTIGSSATITGHTVVLSAAGNFVNSRGSDAVSASDRWLIYTSAPGTATFGSLNSNNTTMWSNTYATLAPASVTLSGNRYIFAQTATLTFTSSNDSKTYGDTANLSLYTVSGLQSGVANAFLADTNATAFSGSPALSSSGATATATVAGSPYTIAISQGTLSSASGYGFAFTSSGTLTVNARPITVTADARTRMVGTGDPSLTYQVTSGSLYGSDSFSGALIRAPGEAIGSYPITQGTLAASPNYALTFVGATLVITPNPAVTMTSTMASIVTADFTLGALDPLSLLGPATFSFTPGIESDSKGQRPAPRLRFETGKRSWSARSSVR